MLAELQWLRPLWLLGLLPIAPLLILSYRQSRTGRWQAVLPPHLARRLFTSTPTARRRRRLGPLTLALAWLLAVLALAGPSLPLANQPSYSMAQARVLLLDLSLSMLAGDLPPDRLSRARFKALDLLQHWQQGETGLIGYAGDAFMISPLTTDVANISNLVPHLSPELMPVPGSNLLAALELADRMLRQSGYRSGELVVFSDGISPSQRQQVLEFAADLPWRISVLAFGTPEGAPVTLANGELLKDRQGRIVLPGLDPGPLAQLARQGGGRLVGVRSDSRDIEQLLDTRPDPGNARHTENRVTAREDLGYWLVLPLLPLALLLFHRAGGPLWLLLLTTLPLPGRTLAMEWWHNADQQGARLFQQQRFADAARQFQDPLWRGSAWYRAGDYPRALQEFSRVDTATGWYNRGNALASQHRYDEAIEAYRQALQREPHLTDARHNLELVEQAARQSPPPQAQQQAPRDPSQSGKEAPATAPGKSTPAGVQGQSSSGSGPENHPLADAEPAAKDAASGSAAASPAGADGKEQARPSSTPSADGDGGLDRQRLRHWLGQLPDDPSLLLRNKLQRQYQRRQHPPTEMEEPW